MASSSPRLVAWTNRLLGRFILPQQQMRASQFEMLPRPAIDVVFLGDSITEYGLWNEWFPQLSVANRGIAGDTTAGLLRRMATAVGTQRIVSLLIGTNDLAIGTRPDTIAANVTEIMTTIARADPSTTVLLNSVMPRARAYRDRVIELNRRLAAVADAQEAVFLDLWPVLADGEGVLRPELSIDRLHLTGAGYLAWVNTLRAHIA